MPTNFYMFFVVALIPLLTGFIYYHPKVFGTTWMNVNGFTEESMKGGNMAVILGLTYLLSVLLALALSGIVIHQSGAFSTIGPAALESGSAAQQDFNELMSKYGNNFRTFGHGALHGFIISVIFALPIIGINSLFERRGGKYVLIHWGYWAITLVLMGGILCQVLKYAPLT